MDDKRKLATSEVAAVLGIKHKTLNMFVLRNPDIMPTERLPNSDFLWGEVDIQRLIERRSKRKKRTVKPKGDKPE